MLAIIICLFVMLLLGFIAGWEAKDWDQEKRNPDNGGRKENESF